MNLVDERDKFREAERPFPGVCYLAMACKSPEDSRARSHVKR